MEVLKEHREELERQLPGEDLPRIPETSQFFHFYPIVNPGEDRKYSLKPVEKADDPWTNECGITYCPRAGPDSSARPFEVLHTEETTSETNQETTPKTNLETTPELNQETTQETNREANPIQDKPVMLDQGHSEEKSEEQ